MHIASQILTHTGSNRHAFCWWLVQLQRSFVGQYVMVTNDMVMCLQWGLSHSMNSLCMISSAMTWQTTTAETKNVAAAFKQRCGNGLSWWKRSEEKGGRNLRSTCVYEVVGYAVVPALNISARLTLQKLQFFFFFLHTFPCFSLSTFISAPELFTGKGWRNRIRSKKGGWRKGKS